jgi:hypothetical protein
MVLFRVLNGTLPWDGDFHRDRGSRNGIREVHSAVRVRETDDRDGLNDSCHSAWRLAAPPPHAIGMNGRDLPTKCSRIETAAGPNASALPRLLFNRISLEMRGRTPGIAIGAHRRSSQRFWRCIRCSDASPGVRVRCLGSAASVAWLHQRQDADEECGRGRNEFSATAHGTRC